MDESITLHVKMACLHAYPLMQVLLQKVKKKKEFVNNECSIARIICTLKIFTHSELKNN
jgi:hypothetical protein